MSEKICATYKLLERNLLHGSLRAGAEIAIGADQLFMHDGTGTLVFLHLQNLPRLRLGQKLAICYHDHNTLGDGGPENADDQRFLETACARHGVVYSRPGNGIGHLLHLERFCVPGQLLLGADTHVITAGAAGMLALACGGLELAAVMTGTPHYLTCPAVVRVVLQGRLPPWCSAKDLALELLARMAGRQCNDTSLEFCGEGVKTLSLSQRATLANMCAELGVTSALFPADQNTRRWLMAQGRGRAFRHVEVPARAEVADEISLELNSIEPMVAMPPSPLKAVPVRSVCGLEVHQVAVGTCTNGSFEDIARLAAILAGRKIHPGVSLVVAPGTRQTLNLLLKQGWLNVLTEAGARLAEPACGFCVGQGFAPATGTVSLRTSSRNFEGRCGTRDAQVYLAGPETAAATALRGHLCDPRDLGRSAPRFVPPTRYPVNDALIIWPPPEKSRSAVKIRRGPNIVDPPPVERLPPSIEGVVTIKLGDNITTDHILPSGPHLRFRSNVQEYAWHTFRVLDPRFVHRAKDLQQQGLSNIIVAGHEYGSGSSREHAALCPAVLGVRVVMAKGIERVHLANLVEHGIVPLIFLDPRDYDRIRQGDDLEFPWLLAELRRSSLISARSHDRGYELKLKHSLTRRQIDMLLAGGLCNYVCR